MKSTSSLFDPYGIASCPGPLDAMDTAQAKKLDTLKTHKQGLMQGLFPEGQA